MAVVMVVVSLQCTGYESKGNIAVVDDVKTILNRLQPHRRSCWNRTPLHVGWVDLRRCVLLG